MFQKISHILLLLFTFQIILAQQLAFPHAKGFGRFASGGRSGEVYHVTNLNDSGKGSFRDAVSENRRTVVFDVSGVIRIKDKIKAASNLTVAGQTSPGKGITVYGNSISFSSNTIVRYMRFRGSIDMPRGACTVVADNLENIIFDHVSIEWGRWDNLHVKNSRNVTFQNCLIGEAIDPQRFGALFEHPENITVYRCLWIDNQSRNPKAKAKIEYINNIIYNWGRSGFVGGHSSADHYQDVIGNYFMAGPSSPNDFLDMFSKTDHVYHKANFVDLNKDGKINGRLVADLDFTLQKATLQQVPSLYGKSNVQAVSATEAFEIVLKEVGASLRRDDVDKRLISYLKSKGRKGAIFKTEAAAGGQPAVKVRYSKKKDSDGDGIPDRWEKNNALEPSDSSDGKKKHLSGYSNLEMYLNQEL